MISERLVHVSALNEGLGILRIHLNRLIEHLKRFFILRLLAQPQGYVQVDGRIVRNVEFVKFNAILELRDGSLDVALLKTLSGLFLHLVAQLDILNGFLDHLVLRIQLESHLKLFLSENLISIIENDPPSHALDSGRILKLLSRLLAVGSCI